MNRRDFLRTLGAGGASLALGCGHRATQPADGTAAQPPPVTPNVLVIVCDQLRYPRWFPQGAALDALLPNMAGLRARSVSFGAHFTAAIQCSPARASLLTGLYGRQHFCLKNVGPFLDPRIPTWATLIGRLGLGYELRWFGKWHLSGIDAATADATWQSYGFSPGLAYDPFLGEAPSTGDAATLAQFGSWIAGVQPGAPWCATVSLVNPHDIATLYGIPETQPGPLGTWASAVDGLAPPVIITELPRNYESAAALRANKPLLQTFFLQAMDTYGFRMPHADASDETVQAVWLKLLNLYLQIQQGVDAQIGQLLATLAASPHAANTIVVFTADHGEYGGSHGLRNKHGGAYDETLHIPLYVYDPTGYWTVQPEIERAQMSSSVDVAPLLLTMIAGGGAWRSLAGFEHLARRPDLTTLLRDPAAAAVRSYILHSVDSIGPGPATLLDGSGLAAANQVAVVRTLHGKLARYQTWQPGTSAVDPNGLAEDECYDYGTDQGVLELANLGRTPNAVRMQLLELFHDQAVQELAEPLVDPDMQAGQAAALAAYWASGFSP